MARARTAPERRSTDQAPASDAGPGKGRRGKMLVGGTLVVVLALVAVLVGRARLDHGNGAASRRASVAASPPGPVVRTVPASIASDCSKPVDADLNSFLGTVPDGATIRFAASGCYGLDDSLWVT